MTASAASTAEATAPPLSKAYEDLCKKLKELSHLEGVSKIMSWDEMVMMPPGAASSRGAQKAAFEGVLYDKRTDKEVGSLLEQLWAHKEELDEVAVAVVRDARKDYIRSTAIPKDMAQRLAALQTEAYAAWAQARKDSDFTKFAPFLKQLVELSKEKARLIDPALPPYDVLLDEYEKGLTAARIDEIFTQVRDGVVPLLKDLREKGKAPDSSWIMGDWEVTKQAELCKQVALDLGFDLDTGRVDVSVHPFTIDIAPSDVRITTRFKAEDLTEGVTGAIHETGHALFEQNLNREWDGLPVQEPLSLGIHESQSLFWERMVALGLPFCRYLLPKIREYLPDFPNRPEEDLYAALNIIREPSFIRVEADEVTYPLHIILRYEIEKGLIDGTVAVDDVPALWNEKMQQYLGVAPPSDAQGCLQDIHWSSGAFGYFPTYSLGAMFACQLYQAAAKDIPDLEAHISGGNFKPLKEWLKVKIHQKGSLYPNGDELMVAATGSPLQPQVFLEYLTTKYRALYKL